MSGEDGVVGLYDRRGHAWRGIDGKLEFRFLPIVGRETFEEKSAKARTGAAAK